MTSEQQRDSRNRRDHRMPAVGRDYIFFAGCRIAWRDSSCNVYYYFADAIGSTRAVTNATGTVCFSADYYPYGQENAWCASRMALRDDYDTSCLPTYRFTGYEYDSETGNAFFASRTDLRGYYAYARYYSPRLGRFMSPDPLGGSILNPQSLNRYAYVLNNPETFIDPLGMDAHRCIVGIDAGTELPIWGYCATTYHFTGVGGLKEALFSFFSEATGMNGCVLGWCTPTPPPDTIAYTIASTLEKRVKAAWDLAKHSPWVLSGVVPVAPFPLVAGVGVAFDVEANPRSNTFCVGLGAGLAGGRTASFGPLPFGKMFNGEDYPSGADSILNGPSVSGGGILPFGVGVQGVANGSGWAAGPAVGVPGLSAAATDSTCWTAK